VNRILIVDDDPVALKLHKLKLESTLAYEVFTESKGELAVEAARKCKPDLVLLDVLMPDLLGSEVAAALRADPLLKHIKVVYLTSMVKRNEEQHSGADPIIGKPVSTKDLLAVVAQVLGSGEAMQFDHNLSSDQELEQQPNPSQTAEPQASLHSVVGEPVVSGKALSGLRRETVDELSSVLSLTQRISLRLANETHGYARTSVKELNELLYQARVQLDRIMRLSP
jgi:CheY-like chemotaxis protein